MPADTASLDPSIESQQPVVPSPVVAASAESSAPYVASLAPVNRTPSATSEKLVLEFSGESWMQVAGRDGGTPNRA